ncbi:MAG: ADOP family duplicated permease [Gemmatimonadaceae bacterium]
MRAELLYAKLVALYPRDFRERFGRDMSDLFADQLRRARRAGTMQVLRLLLRTLSGTVYAALLEHADALRDRLAAPDALLTQRPGDGPMRTLLADLRFAIRLLGKSPLFTLVTVVVIALGTGAVTTIYSALNALVLRPLPGVAQADRVVGLEFWRKEGNRQMTGTASLIDQIAARQHTLVSLAGWNRDNVTVFPGREGIATPAVMVTSHYFSTLGIAPERGRFFLAAEDSAAGATPVMVVSHAFWTTKLGGDPGIVGRSLMVNGTAFTVVGVTPPEFLGTMPIVPANLFIPLTMESLLFPGQPRAVETWIRPIARLKDGVTLQQAEAELTALVRDRSADGSEVAVNRQWDRVRPAMLRAVPEDARSGFLGFISLLLGAAGLLMLIASVNVASMLSARAIARRREMAVRAALGAGRWRLIRQLLTESLLLFVAGSMGGVLIAVFATSLLEQQRIAIARDLALEISPDPRAFLLALGVALVTGIAFGLAPALRAARRDINSQLRTDTAGSGVRRTFMANALITGQLASSLVLLVSAGLFVRAISVSSHTDTGFNASGVATVQLDPQSWGYSDARGATFFRDLQHQVSALPGVTAVSYSLVLPMTMSGSDVNIEIDGRDHPTKENEPAGESVKLMSVDEGYFDVVRTPMSLGRAFLTSDDSLSAPVAVVSEALSRRYWPDGGAIGRAFTYHQRRYTVVGIARDAKYESIDEAPAPIVYFAMRQQGPSSRFLILRSAQPPAAIAEALASVVRAMDPTLPRPVVVALDEANEIAVLPQRIAAVGTGLFGGLGLIMAAVGLYGIISYSVNRRTREIGVRMALGAQRTDVLALVVGEGLRLTGVGVVLGLVLAGGATRLLSKFLLNTNPLDAVAFGGMSMLFVAVALFASYVPARRAAKADPMSALRTD